MSSEPAKSARLKPLFLIKPNSMSARDIRRAEKLAGICIAECEAPEAARFLEPPIDADIDVQARAALSLMRYIVTETSTTTAMFYGSTLIKRFVDMVIASPRPPVVPHVKEVKR